MRQYKSHKIVTAAPLTGYFPHEDGGAHIVVHHFDEDTNDGEIYITKDENSRFKIDTDDLENADLRVSGGVRRRLPFLVTDKGVRRRVQTSPKPGKTASTAGHCGAPSETRKPVHSRRRRVRQAYLRFTGCLGFLGH